MQKKILKSLKKNINYIMILIIVCLFFMFFYLFFSNKIQNIDNQVMNYFNNNIRNENFLSSIKFITHFGDKIVFGIIIICTFILLKDKKYSIYMVINLLFVLFVNLITKYSFQRDRPPLKLIPESGYSFPSGHTMCATSFYALLFYLMYKNTNNKLLKVIYICTFIIIVFIIGFTRIYLNVHYLSDVIGGIILGLLCVLIFIKVMNDLEEKK